MVLFIINTNMFDWDEFYKTASENDIEEKVVRASKDCICPVCNKEYGKHIMDNITLSYTGEPYLHRICIGILAKL